MCITTDGVAGDPLTQQPCSGSGYQVWNPSYVWWAGGSMLYNPASGLVMDVQGDSYGVRRVDAWYPNNGLNQVFSMPGQPGFQTCAAGPSLPTAPEPSGYAPGGLGAP